MWNRSKEHDPDAGDIGKAEEGLRALLRREENSFREPDLPYWQNLLVRTNARIDEVASGRAISLSWALRVALPGAVAILFFFIGLHYYTPESGPAEVSVHEYVSGFPEASRDSLYDYLLGDQTLNIVPTGLYGEAYSPDGDDVEQYFLSLGETNTLLEEMSDEQLNELIGLLRSEANHSIL